METKWELRKLGQMQERLLRHEDCSAGTLQSERKRKMPENKKRIQDDWNYKAISDHHFVVSGEQKKGGVKGIENLFNKLIGENAPNLRQDVDVHI